MEILLRAPKPLLLTRGLGLELALLAEGLQRALLRRRRGRRLVPSARAAVCKGAFRATPCIDRRFL